MVAAGEQWTDNYLGHNVEVSEVIVNTATDEPQFVRFVTEYGVEFTNLAQKFLRSHSRVES